MHIYCHVFMFGGDGYNKFRMFNVTATIKIVKMLCQNRLSIG